MEPTDKEIQYIDPHGAKETLGDNAIHVEGLSMILYDTDQFMDHFYHWWGEIILGSWRVYSAFIQYSNASWPPPLPARFILPHIYLDEWHDRAGVNAPLMRACFSSASIEKQDYWLDLIALNRTVVFERAMIVSREAARRHPFSDKWYKMMAGTMDVPTLDNFWEYLRSTTIFNFLGYLPTVVVNPIPGNTEKPIITYISRQGAGRRLIDKDHELLVESLKLLEDEGICEVFVAMMERMSLHDQIDLVSRSTILIGVHGNGLTHQLWMPPSHRSTVIEIFIPKAYVFDYELPARNLGHRHYAVWNDTLITYPKGTYYKGITYGDGFHGNSIPVYGPAVARVIRERLTEPITSRGGARN
ncbi:hypothetical protein BDZ94DRAFT_1248380 [Collybia nuda]|uniref:Glycosyltransferase 61 catalytic domain-containing protein n=1 Tax=Collybia nuda TaxID=64659 RepID=A0A9P6CIE8_9AGAR|nr:hypothetical protein BDZ94DRAFT_1248380 [Collybia nuda]